MNRRTLVFTLLFLICAIIMFGLSLSLGSSGISLRELFGDNEDARTIIFLLRLPRALGAVVSGMALAVSGLLLQNATGNELASPNIIGVNSGSGFFVLLILLLVPSLYALVPVAAFIGALSASMLVLGISEGARSTNGKAPLVLSGIAVNALFNALVLAITSTHNDILSSYSSFSAGGFAEVYWEKLGPAVLVVPLVLVVLVLSRKLSFLILGKELATGLGMNADLLRRLSVVLASALAAVSVTISGLLGFVGLVVPHIAKLLVGEDFRKRLPLCIVLGPTLVMAADLAARTMFAPSELPAGVFTSLIGVPFFVYLLLRRHHA